jgi:protoheme IX farnesyltransferase
MINKELDITSGKIGQRIIAKIKDYVALTKPKVISLLLLVGLSGCFIGAQGFPDLNVIVGVLVGGAFAAGGAGSLNMAYEHKLDRAMGRTKNRPVAENRISTLSATIWGVLLNILSFVVLYTLTNIIAALLALLGTALYFFLYTMILKTRTTQNIVIGGIAGCMPPLVGYAAASGTIDLTAAWMFLIVFFWTPPHFWALSLMIKDDYAKIGIPMLPVVKGEHHTRMNIIVYSVVLSLFTVAFTFVNQELNLLYGTTSFALSLVFIIRSINLGKTQDKTRALSLYKYSILYLALVFIFAVVDTVVL